jgi:O-antigen/teichoic acid export membrane protein
MNLHHHIEKHLKIDSRYFLSGGFWLVSAQGMIILASLLSTVFLTHYLDEHDFGIYRYVISVGMFLTSLSLTGIAQSVFQAALKKVAGFYDNATRLTLLYSSGIVVAGLLATGYYYFQGNTTLAVGCVLIAILTPWSLLLQNAHGQLLGQNRFSHATYLLTIKSFFIAGTTIITLLFSSNILILLAVYFVSQAVVGVLSHWYARPRYEQIQDRTAVHSLVSFAQHTSFRNIIVGISSRLDNLIVFQQLGAASLATFTIATLLPDQIKGSLKHLVTLLIPKFSQYETVAEVRRFLPLRSLQAGLILVLVTLVTIAVTPLLIETLFPKYVSAIPYAQLLALSFPASIYQIPFAMMQAHTTEKALYSYHVLTAFFQIGFTIIGIFFFGLIGAVGARILTQYTQLLISWFAVYRHA